MRRRWLHRKATRDAKLSMGRRRPLSCMALVVATVSAATSVPGQQQAPSGDELRSMYCIEVVRAEIDLQHHLISAADSAAASAVTPDLRQQWINTSAELLQGLASLELVRYRLQTYMLPRIPALEPLALAAAVRQGATDFQESRAVADRCALECNPQQSQSAQSLACSASCGNDSALGRITACYKPAWLPP
jgi:hypothetical protein